MKESIEFVKKFGVDVAKDALSVACLSLKHVNYNNYALPIDDLKQIVESFELVEKRGGLAEAKAVEQQYWNSGVGSAMFISMELKQAIELVEKCNES